MFLFKIKETRAELRGQSEIDSVINKMKSEGYSPVLRSMAQAACTSIDIPVHVMSVNALIGEQMSYRRPDIEESPIGDVLYKDKHVYLIYPQGMRLDQSQRGISGQF